MKRNINQRRNVADRGPRHSRSDHGNKSNNLYTPPLGKMGRNVGTSGGGESALLKRLEKITNEINSMQAQQPNSENKKPPNAQFDYFQQIQLGAPQGYPPSFANASPRAIEFSNESPRQMNEYVSNQQQHTAAEYPQNQSQQQFAYGNSLSQTVRTATTVLSYSL